MKWKRFGSIAIAMALMLSISSYATVESNTPVETVGGDSGGILMKITGNDVYFSTFDNAWAGTIVNQNIKVGVDTWNLETIKNNRFIEDFDQLFTNGYLYIFKTAQTVATDLTITKDIKINSAKEAAYGQITSAISHTFSGQITIQDGGSLSFIPGHSNQGYPSEVTTTFSKPIIVKSGGSLRMDSVNPMVDQEKLDVFKLADSATEPLVKIEMGGSAAIEGVVLEAAGAQNILEVNGTLELDPPSTHDLTIKSTENAAAIKVGSTGILKISQPYRKIIVSATGSNTPAIAVEAGGTIELPADSTNISVTASNNETQAIDLAGGAIVKKGDIVTVIVSQENEDAGDNYVDNYGNIILAKGARAGTDADTMNAAVILPNGTIIQGSPDEAPTLKTEMGTDGKTTTTVTIPKNGSVTKPGEQKHNKE